MISKNDIFTVDITDQDDLGSGIGKVDGFPLFIRHAVMGDTAKICVTKAKKNYGYARVLEIEKESPYRTQPACECYKRCGGCQLQLMTYEGQLEFKHKRVEACLKRIGGIENPNMEPIIGSDEVFRYRNKAQYPVGTDKDGNIVSGFFAERTHDIIPCSDCLLCPEEYGKIVDEVKGWMKKYGVSAYNEVTGKGVVRHIFIRKGFATDEIILCLVINAKELPFKEELSERLQASFENLAGLSVSVNTKKSNVIMGNNVHTIFGKGYIEDYIGDIKYRVSPLSFYQVNPGQTKKLYDKVLEYADLNKDETVIDLYCGTGTISLYMAGGAKTVYGIEIVPEAIEDAKKNAELNNIDNAQFYAGGAEEVLPKLYNEGLKSADVVVVDPPRKGCDELTLSTIAKIAPKRLVYVSCNPATLARDVKFLQDKGFTFEKATPVDMFPMSVHVETVAILKGSFQG